jgi:hypothetical protein
MFRAHVRHDLKRHEQKSLPQFELRIFWYHGQGVEPPGVECQGSNAWGRILQYLTPVKTPNNITKPGYWSGVWLPPNCHDQSNKINPWVFWLLT